MISANDIKKKKQKKKNHKIFTNETIFKQKKNYNKDFDIVLGINRT